ncbi:ATP-grasp domain-containing protein [Paenibacillus sp. M1]|uniref:ATP-grasp domain-containing protein n=1 Tax=Paenibacillus haidiansis TaxID=1574488 RepID=A0ABU7VTK7_9BACL
MSKHIIIFLKFENFSRIVNEGLPSHLYEKTLITNDSALLEKCKDHYHHFLYAEQLSSPQVVDFVMSLHAIKHVDGVFSPSEDLVEFLAFLRKQLGITDGVVGDDAVFFRNKVEMKNRLAQDKVILIPRYCTVYRFENAVDFLNSKSSEAIIKPVDGAGSLNTYRVNLSNINDYFDLLNNNSGKYEIEEFIEGSMFHLDSIIHKNEIVFTSVARYTHSTLECRDGRPLCGYFLPDHYDPLIKNLISANTDLLNSMPIKDGVTHAELIVTPDQEIYFCEVAARIAGGGIIFGIEATTGVNVLTEGARTFVGEPPIFKGRFPQTYGGYVLLYKKKGRVKQITQSSEFLQIKGVKRADILAKAGDELNFSGSSGDVVGVVTWSADSFADNDRIRSEIERLWSLEVEEAVIL